ncbi:hypothetical protein COLO4_04993 [Corchorus olitorius]|uniref:Uncharacterized protein n=1 Tax=Corchorus olitorius TaxID=93759 RepID=A0A1R3KSC4_9ROSI|nr:hypothetical protein COLO4_04993 [Corchorus olitorius]
MAKVQFSNFAAPSTLSFRIKLALTSVAIRKTY